MKHTVIYRRDGWYTAFPQLDVLPDGRMAIGVNSSPFHDHNLIGEWKVLVSDDEGDSWSESDDPTIPYNWDGSGVDERYRRYAEVLADGTYLSAGSVGFHVWPSEKRQAIEERGLFITEHPVDKDKFVSGSDRMFVQRSTDGGKTWDRRVYVVPAVQNILSFPRPIKLAGGVIVIPVTTRPSSTNPAVSWWSFTWRSADGGRTFRLVPMAPAPSTEEIAFLEVSPGRLLALARAEPAPGYLLEMWSDDAGLTWSHPVESQIWTPNSPPHLLRLKDGQVLCTYGYREQPMGIRAVLSRDDGETWDTDNEYILRDDGGVVSKSARQVVSRRVGPRAMADVGYAQSTELADESILSVYYITLADGVTHAACTRWEL